MANDRAVSEPPDDALLARMASGDGTALGELYDRHGGALFGYLMRLARDRQIAEEILQDTLLAAWSAAAGFEGRSAVRTWLFGIARRQAHNRLRGRHLSLAPFEHAGDAVSGDLGPEDALVARSERDQVAAAMRRLRPLHAEVLGLAFVDELPHKQIAAVLDVPVGTVKSRLFHAKAALAAQLDRVRREDRP